MFEHDSCGIVAVIEKNGTPTRSNLLQTIDALIKMEHRAGFIDGEGDGTGILTDIPKEIWQEKLRKANLPPDLVYDYRFTVAHLFLAKSSDLPLVKEGVLKLIQEKKFTPILTVDNAVNSDFLGKQGKEQEPFFWQIAMIFEEEGNIEKALFDLTIALEANFPLHVASLNNHSVVYKILGNAKVLAEYYHDLQNELFKSRISIGHNRYSTNTLSNFYRVQPFSLLGHNGEINTIKKLRDEAKMLNIPLVEGGSDSQDLNRVIEGFIAKYNLTLFEALEITFPPIINEIIKYPPELIDLYVYYRQIWGPFAQGPAGIVSRYGNEAVFSIDALGLRPLWQVETDEQLIFSSEQGIISPYEMVSEPKPLGPGEKVGVLLVPQKQIKIFSYRALQNYVYQQTINKVEINGLGSKISYHNNIQEIEQMGEIAYEPLQNINPAIYAAFAWNRDQLDLAQQMGETGNEVIRSIGYDGPLAILDKERKNLADFLKESVAVVTNPAIDREREIEHFSTRTILGPRPNFYAESKNFKHLEIFSPILLEGELSEEAAQELKTITFEQVVNYFRQGKYESIHNLSLSLKGGESVKQALQRLQEEAILLVKHGATILILNDKNILANNELWLDPHLVVSAIDTALKEVKINEHSIRRNVSLILRSASLRNLHDLITAIGLGADAISPYLLFATIKEHGVNGIKNLFQSLNKGIEKVIATIGIHELRGYERQFSSIGLNQEIVDYLQIINYFGNEKVGYNFEHLLKDALERKIILTKNEVKINNLYRIFPRIWKAIGQVATNTIKYQEYLLKLQELEISNPITLRHLLQLKEMAEEKKVNHDEVDISIGNHALPLVISSMSFGSQNEVAFRAYAEAAHQLNMISLNGEGGEIKDIRGKYLTTRGIQIASGRFGVNAELINSSYLIELKIGQGAKPGEGGHLPGAKVTIKVAEARNATPGTDLISPANNHDIYSIEDLAQFISEIKTANQFAKMIVKVPVVPNIGTIAVGIAKAGANVISLSGYDGGTGAARAHALQFVGLPIEIGVSETHAALLEAGLREQVEIWADGGLKSGLDVIKLMLMGANRAGFGTLAMIAVGCTTCRGCHLGTCHVGIATQIETEEEALNLGLKRFVPREYNRSVENLKRLFLAIGEEIREITAKLGYKRTQDLVGHGELLEQIANHDLLDLSSLTQTRLLKKEISISKEIGKAINNLEQPEKIDYNLKIENLSIDNNQHIIYSTKQIINSQNRILLSRQAGDLARLNVLNQKLNTNNTFTFPPNSIAGNGFASYIYYGIKARIIGGAQDGVAKTGYGGLVSILKTKNKNGVYINGSVGKGFAYGAQKGLFIVQGNADSRAGIRLSGADLIIGGRIKAPLNDKLDNISVNANIKGFAFEYMTNGRVVVLGDPGPWICSGMTGGVVYLHLQPDYNFDLAAVRRRVAKGANVVIRPVQEKGTEDIYQLLTIYQEQLLLSGQEEEANYIANVKNEIPVSFLEILPNQKKNTIIKQTEEIIQEKKTKEA